MDADGLVASRQQAISNHPADLIVTNVPGILSRYMCAILLMGIELLYIWETGKPGVSMEMQGLRYHK